ncbi:probable inactive protein kinase DDB_G0270444 [Littorina saxatilis]
MATTLQFYHWELKDRQILQLITDTPPTLSGPLPQIQTEEEEIADEQAAPKEHQQDELVKPSEEEHMSKEDLEDMNQRLRETTQSETKLGDEEEPTLENTNKSESVMSHFPAHIVTDSMCNICGRLASQENVPTSKAEDEQTSLHQETEVEYRRFHAECQEKVALSLDKIDSFFTEIQMEQHRHLYDENSAELACFDKFKKVKQMVLDAIDGRQWDKIDDLIREVQELQNIFVNRNVESTLSEVFNQHKKNHPEQIAESSCRTTLGRPLSLCSAADFLVDE